MREIIPQSIGFFLMIVPSVLLMYLPFSEKSFRWNKRKVCSTNIVITLVLCLIYSGTLLVLPHRYYDYFTDLYMVIVVSVLLLIFSNIVTEPFAKRAVAFSVSVFYVATSFLLRCLLIHFSPTLVSGGFRMSDIPYLIGISAVLIPLGAWIARRILARYISDSSIEIGKQETVIIFVILMQYIGLIVLYIFLFKGSNHRWKYITPLFIVLTLFIIVIYWLIFVDGIQKIIEDNHKHLLESRILQYRKIEREIEATRRYQHDMKHYLANAYTLMAENENEKAMEYLEEIGQKILSVNSEIFCQNMAVNNVLQYYLGWAKDLGIQCSVSVDIPRYFLEDDDLTVLFGNLLDDAVNVAGICKEEKKLSLRAETIGSSFAVSCEYSCDQIYPSSSYHPMKQWQSSRAYLTFDHQAKYTFHSIEDIANKYHGTSEFQYDEETRTFTVRVLLQIES